MGSSKHLRTLTVTIVLISPQRGLHLILVDLVIDVDVHLSWSSAHHTLFHLLGETRVTDDGTLYPALGNLENPLLADKQGFFLRSPGRPRLMYFLNDRFS